MPISRSVTVLYMPLARQKPVDDEPGKGERSLEPVHDGEADLEVAEGAPSSEQAVCRQNLHFPNLHM